jgi:3-methyladenine DNA glycosylase AlkC
MGAMNELINVNALGLLATQLHRAAPDRDFDTVTAITAAQLEPLNLRARSDLAAAALIADLPTRYDRAAAIVRMALKDPAFAGWAIWPVTEAVTTVALDAGGSAAFDDGLVLLSELSPRLTSEFAIRRFLEADLPRALRIVETWTRHPDAAVRRLASEGTRPFLPWAIRVRSILAAPECTVAILDALRDDESDDVRRSVANHLNDLSRENAELVVALATAWLRAPGPRTRSVVRHGLRTLIKRADPGALALMGFAPAKLTVTDPVLASEDVVAPGSLDFTFTVTNDGEASAQIAIDYVIHFLKSNGSRAEKVFKLATRILEPHQTARLGKSHAFRPMTTRVHYAGVHALEIQVNGARSGYTEFRLEL